MNRTRFVILGVVLLAGASVITLEFRFAARERAELRALRQREATLERELADLRQQGGHITRELRMAEDQLGRLPVVATPRSTSDARGRDPAVADWLGRTRKLRELLVQRPEHAIPELQLLLDEDWLRISRDAAFETDADQRRALAALREAAKARLIARFVAAVKKFTALDFTRVPTSIDEIAAHLDPPVDPAILARYEIKSNPTNSKSRPRWFIRDRVAADEDYDKRIRVESTGSHGSSSGPFVWNEDLADQMRRAQQSFATKKPGVRPANFAEVIPYAEPPFPPATVERLLRWDRERPK